ncbi:MAG: DUF3499 family protein [Actinomycetota bacterium]
MRTCAKMRCEAGAIATVALRYGEREVLVADLTPQPDRNLLDLCEEHIRTLKPPLGWRIRDDRNVLILPDVAASEAGSDPEPAAPSPDVGTAPSAVESA